MAVDQMNILSLLGMDDDVVEVSAKEKAKKTESNKKTAPAANNNSNNKNQGDKLEVNTETIIRHEGINIPITAYFSEQELTEGILKDDGKPTPITEEDIRERMETQVVFIGEESVPFGPCIELLPDYTVVVFSKKKNMVMAIPSARKKGASTSVCRKNEVTAPAVASFLHEKIPFSILLEFMKVAYHYAKYNMEVHGDIFWNVEEQKYELIIPEQKVTRVNCYDFVHDCMEIMERDLVKKCEIHSHHFMQTFPSPTDDADEKREKLVYCIIGDFGNPLYPNLYTRTYKDGEYITLDSKDVFYVDMDLSVSMDALNNVKEGLPYDLPQVHINGPGNMYEIVVEVDYYNPFYQDFHINKYTNVFTGNVDYVAMDKAKSYYSSLLGIDESKVRIVRFEEIV